MKTLLLNPPAKRISEKKDIPRYQHVGMGYLVSSVEKAGYVVKAIDAKLDHLGVKGVLKMIKDYSPDILGITAMTHEVEMASVIARDYKKINPCVKVVLGGVHITALPEDTLKRYSSIDIGIIGEGEHTFPLVIKAFEKNKEVFCSISGVVFRNENGMIKCNDIEWIQNLDSLSRPGWKHFKNAKDYIIITSRGCPYSCIFCMQASGKVVRKRSAENIVEEIEKVIEERAPEKFLFYDETFTLDKQRVHAICDLLIRKGLNKKIKWSTTTRVDAVDRNVLSKMKEAGCNHIEFGVESGNEEMLKRIKKGISRKQAERAVSLAKELNFHTEGAFILGLPHENMESALETIDFAAKLNPDIVQLGIMVPYPGTEVRSMALRQEGGYKLLSNDWAEYNKQLGNALETDTLSRADLERLQLIGYLRLFMYNRRYWDFIKFIFNFKREMLSYLRNIYRKRKETGKSRVSFFKVMQLVFSKSNNLASYVPKVDK